MQLANYAALTGTNPLAQELPSASLTKENDIMKYVNMRLAAFLYGALLRAWNFVARYFEAYCAYYDEIDEEEVA